MIRHEFDTMDGDRLTLLIQEDGALRLVQVWPAPFEDKDLLPRDHAYALLALAADLLRERVAARKAVAALKPSTAIRSRPSMLAGFEAAQNAALAALEGAS